MIGGTSQADSLSRKPDSRLGGRPPESRAAAGRGLGRAREAAGVKVVTVEDRDSDGAAVTAATGH